MEPNFYIFQRIPTEDVWYKILGSWGTHDSAYDHLASLGAVYVDLQTLLPDIVYYVSRQGHFIIVNVSQTGYTIQKDKVLGDIIVITK